MSQKTKGHPMTKVGALLMAAGNSRRMGGPNKLLMTLHNQPLIRFSMNAVRGGKFATRMIITGHDGENIAALAEGFEVVHNPRFIEGFGTSLAAGFSVLLLQPDIDGALVMLADMPLIKAVQLTILADAFGAENGQAVIRAAHNGQPGNPVIIPRSLFSNMAKLDGDQSGQAIIKASGLPLVLVEIGPAALADADTPQALAALQEAVL
jgi:molybdenum cofactor cytidylyltransferase